MSQQSNAGRSWDLGCAGPSIIDMRMQMLSVQSGSRSSTAVYGNQAPDLTAMGANNSFTISSSVPDHMHRLKVPALPLGRMPAHGIRPAAAHPASAHEAPPSPKPSLPVVAYKPKPQPKVDVAFGYRVGSNNSSSRHSRSASLKGPTVLDANCGSLVASSRRSSTTSRRSSGGRDTDTASSRSKGVPESPRAGSRRSSNSSSMGPGLAPHSTMLTGSKSCSSDHSESADGGSASRIPRTPRTSAKQSTGTSNSTSHSSSRLPAPPDAPFASSFNAGKGPAYAAAGIEQDETIFLDCDDGKASNTQGASPQGTFTLSCAISAVFNTPAGDSSKGDNSGGPLNGTSPQSFMQTAAAALSHGLLSAAQQTGSYSQQAQQRISVANRITTLEGSSNSSSSSRNGTSKGRASAGFDEKKASPSDAASNTAVVPRWQLSPCRGVAPGGSNNSSTRPPAQSAAASAKPSSPRVHSAKGVQLVPYGQAGAASNTGMPAAAATGAQHGASILLQLQGDFGGSPTKPQGPSSTESACRLDSETQSEAWLSARSGSVRSESGSESGYPVGSKIRSTPVPSTSSTAEAYSSTGHRRRPVLALRQAGPAAAAGPGNSAPEITDVSRFYSANTAASWAIDSETEGLHALESPFQVQNLHKQPQARQQQQQHAADVRALKTDYLTLESAFAVADAAEAAVTAMQAEAADVEAATDTAVLTCGAAAASSMVAGAEGREVVLTISPAALPFLARKAFTKTPVRLVITPDAVWGEAGAFEEVSQHSPRPSPHTGANINPIKAVKHAFKQGKDCRI